MALEITVFKRLISENNETRYYANNIEEGDGKFDIKDEKSINDLVMMILIKLQEPNFLQTYFELKLENMNSMIQGYGQELVFAKNLSEEEQVEFWEIFRKNYEPKK